MPRAPKTQKAPRAAKAPAPFRYPEGHGEEEEQRYRRWAQDPMTHYLVPVAVRHRLLPPSGLEDDPEATPEGRWARQTGATAVEWLTDLFRGRIKETDPRGVAKVPPIAVRLEAAKLALAYQNRLMPPPVTRAKLETTSNSTAATLTIDPKVLETCDVKDIDAAIEALRKLNINIDVKGIP